MTRSLRDPGKKPCRLKVTQIIQAQTDKKVPELILLLLGQVLYQPLCTVISLTVESDLTKSWPKNLKTTKTSIRNANFHVLLLTTNLFLSVYYTFKTLANNSMEPQGLTGHLQTSHPGHEQPS